MWQALKMTETYDFLADLGGTNVRFALAPAGQHTPESIAKFRNKDFRSFEEAARAYLDGAGNPKLSRACIAVAAPVRGDDIQLTNNNWQLSAEPLRRKLELQQLLFINDFFALAIALPDLKSSERIQIGDNGSLNSKKTRLVIGPGTGLGVCGLLSNGKSHVPMPGEGGHMFFPARTTQEFELIQIVSPNSSGASAEWLLSSSGLERLHVGLAKLSGRPVESIRAEEITQQALAGNAECVETLNFYCKFLGRATGDYALVYGATGGVFLGGGILRNFPEFLAASPFRSEFEDKGMMCNYVHDIPTFLITAQGKTLWGACKWLRQAGIF
jgi:glucokinase|tara:strand:- start:181 stop:1164 length:984 start_codon:yes stop_codon:yes gene_type:complete